VFCPRAVADDLVDAVDDARPAVAAEEQRQNDVQRQAFAFRADGLWSFGRRLLSHILTLITIIITVLIISHQWFPMIKKIIIIVRSLS